MTVKIGPNGDPNGNVEYELEDGVSITGDPVFQYKNFTIYVGVIHNREGRHDLPHYLIFNDEHGVLEGSSNKIVEARLFLTALADANEEQEQKLAKGESLGENKNDKRTHKDWN